MNIIIDILPIVGLVIATYSFIKTLASIPTFEN